MNIRDIVKDKKVNLFGIVSQMVEKETSTKTSTFVDLLFEDKSGSIDVKIWDTNLETLAANGVENGKLVKIRGTVGEWNEKKQIVVEKKGQNILIRAVTDEDNVDINDYIKAAPISPETMLEELNVLVKEFEDKTLKFICSRILKDHEEKLLYYPGAQKLHHAIKGGLLYHMYTMMKLAIPMVNVYPQLNKELLISGVIIHDIGKTVELESDENGKSSGYTNNGYLLGHIIEGIKIINNIVSTTKTQLDLDTILLLEHMIASHHFEETWGAYQKPAFLEAEILHYLDMIDSRMDMFQTITQSLEEDSFSDGKWTLSGRRIYRHKL